MAEFASLLFPSGMEILSWLLWILLIASMLLLIAVILLQEGKGGGLAEAFGGAGAETFGVKAHGINKFTALVGGVFLFLCIVLTLLRVEPKEEALVPGFQPTIPRDPTDLPSGVTPEVPGGANAPNPPPGGTSGGSAKPEGDARSGGTDGGGTDGGSGDGND